EGCSQELPVSWMFRAAYVARYPSETYEMWDQVEYFRLHPGEGATCTSCPDVTCACPSGIDIPRALTAIHDEMTDLRDHGLVAPGGSDASPAVGGPEFRARVRTRDIPASLAPRQTAVCRLHVENAGTRSWFTQKNPHRGGVALGVAVGRGRPSRVFL